MYISNILVGMLVQIAAFANEVAGGQEGGTEHFVDIIRQPKSSITADIWVVEKSNEIQLEFSVAPKHLRTSRNAFRNVGTGNVHAKVQYLSPDCAGSGSNSLTLDRHQV